MKRFILLFALVLVCQYSYGANATLDKIETSLYGYTYSTESDTNRLNRIEKDVYGKTSSGQTNTRINKLKSDMAADLIGQEIKPKTDTFMEEDDYIVREKEPAEAASMDYPVINELENEVFKKEFKNQNIKTRLSNLEKKTFNKTYDNEDLSTRVDRLKAKIKPQSFLANGMEQQENQFYKDPITKLTQNYHLNQYGTPFDYDAYNNNRTFNDYDDDYYDGYFPTGGYSGLNSIQKPSKPLNLSTIEKKLYKTKYENEPTSKRLSRIESSIFGTSFDSDSDSQRIERISSAIAAQKSASRYDSNKFGQSMATAFQIGTLILMVLACIL